MPADPTIQHTSGNTLLNVNTLDKDGNPPELRVSTPSAARNIINQYSQANRGRAEKNAQMRGMRDGNAPYNQGLLDANGQGDRSNVNTMETKGKVSAARVPYYDLFSGGKEPVRIETSAGNGPERSKWSDRMSTRLAQSIRKWKGADFHFQQMLSDYVDFGKGFLGFDDKIDPQFKCVQMHRLRFADGVLSLPENWSIVGIMEDFQCEELWAKIRNKDAASKRGWDVQAVSTAIVNQAAPKTTSEMAWSYDYNWLQQNIKDNVVMEGVRPATVSGSTVLVREYDGSITKMIVTQTAVQKENTIDGQPTEAFLYCKKDAFSEMDECVCPFIFETEDGSINGAQGFLHQVFSLMDGKGRLFNNTMDLANMRCSVLVQAKTAGSYEDLNLISIGRETVLPPDVNIQQSTILGDMQAPVAANQICDNILENNTGIYRTEGQRMKGNPETATAASIRQNNQTILASSAISRFYGFLDAFWYQFVIRMCNTDLPESSSNKGIKMALEFQKKCKEDGVPVEAFKKIESVNSVRVIGNGSSYARQQSLQEMAPAIGFMPEQGKINWAKRIVAAASNQDYVDDFFPDLPMDQVPQEQVENALLENGILSLGMPVIITPVQNDVIHLQVHLAAANSQAEQYTQQNQSGGDPGHLLIFLKGIAMHSQGHLQRLSQNPARKAEFKQFAEQWKQLMQVTQQLSQHAQEQQQQQAAQQEAALRAKLIELNADPETQVAVAQAKQKMQITGAKAQQGMAIKDAKARQDFMRARQDMALADAKTASDINRQMQESLHAQTAE